MKATRLLRIVWTTVRICLITTLFSVTLGYSIAYAMVYCHQRQKNYMLTLLLVSFWISILVRTFSWLMLLGRKGLVNSTLENIGTDSRADCIYAQRIGRADRHDPLHDPLCGACLCWCRCSRWTPA